MAICQGSVELASPNKKERKKEGEFLPSSGSGYRSKVFTCKPVENHTYISMVSVTKLKSVRRICYLSFCNVLRLWSVRAIPTY